MKWPKKRFGKDPRQLTVEERAIALGGLADRYGIAPEHIVNLYYHFAIHTGLSKKWLRDHYFEGIPVKIQDMTPSVIRRAEEIRISYWSEKCEELNQKAGRDMWFFVKEGRDYGMTNRRPVQYDSWDYPKDREYPNTLFGYHVNKVIRWMGADCWTFDEVRSAMRTFGIAITFDEIEDLLEQGRKGIKVKIDLMDEEEIEELYSAKK